MKNDLASKEKSATTKPKRGSSGSPGIEALSSVSSSTSLPGSSSDVSSYVSSTEDERLSRVIAQLKSVKLATPEKPPNGLCTSGHENKPEAIEKGDEKASERIDKGEVPRSTRVDRVAQILKSAKQKRLEKEAKQAKHVTPTKDEPTNPFVLPAHVSWSRNLESCLG